MVTVTTRLMRNFESLKLDKVARPVKKLCARWICVCARVCRGSVSQYQAEKNEIERVTEEQGRRQLSLKGERPSRRRRSVSGIMQSLVSSAFLREYDESKFIREGRDKRIRSGGELLPRGEE